MSFAPELVCGSHDKPKLIRRKPLKHDNRVLLTREIIRRDTRFATSGKSLYEQRFARPTPNSMGLAVTIGIAAAPRFAGRPFIVTVTDMRESFGEEIQGIDIGRTKFQRVTHNWNFLFAGGDARYASPIARLMRQKLGGVTAINDLDEVKDARPIKSFVKSMSSPNS